MVIIEQGVSTKSFIISMVATVLGIASMVWFLQITKVYADLWFQLLCVGVTLSLFVIGGAAWMGKFDKKEPIKAPPEYNPRQPVIVEDEPEKVKPAPKEDWADKWLKENK